jgi:hypothetical protein
LLLLISLFDLHLIFITYCAVAAFPLFVLRCSFCLFDTTAVTFIVAGYTRICFLYTLYHVTRYLFVRRAVHTIWAFIARVATFQAGTHSRYPSVTFVEILLRWASTLHLFCGDHILHLLRFCRYHLLRRCLPRLRFVTLPLFALFYCDPIPIAFFPLLRFGIAALVMRCLPIVLLLLFQIPRVGAVCSRYALTLFDCHCGGGGAVDYRPIPI